MVRGIHFTKGFATNTAHSFWYAGSRCSDLVRFFLDCCTGGKLFTTILTVCISGIALLFAGRFPLIPYFSMCVITFASCNRNAYTFCLVVALVSSCINRSRCHCHTICKCRVLIILLPAPSIRKHNIANLLCAVRRSHFSLRHVRCLSCLIYSKCKLCINSIIIILIWWCKCYIILCLFAVCCCRRATAVLPCKCSCDFSSICCLISRFSSGQGTVWKFLSVGKCACCRLLCNYRCCFSYFNCYCSCYCIVVVSVIRCEYCLIAFIIYSRNDILSCKAPCSGKWIAICPGHTAACHIWIS